MRVYFVLPGLYHARRECLETLGILNETIQEAEMEPGALERCSICWPTEVRL